MDIESLPQDIKFSFILVMQAAIACKKAKRTKKDFMTFTKGIWETLEMNNMKELEEIIMCYMLYDLENIKKGKP